MSKHFLRLGVKRSGARCGRRRAQALTYQEQLVSRTVLTSSGPQNEGSSKESAMELMTPFISSLHPPLR